MIIYRGYITWNEIVIKEMEITKETSKTYVTEYGSIRKDNIGFATTDGTSFGLTKEQCVAPLKQKALSEIMDLSDRLKHLTNVIKACEEVNDNE